jgi:hypothetical protein
VDNIPAAIFPATWKQIQGLAEDGIGLKKQRKTKYLLKIL